MFSFFEDNVRLPYLLLNERLLYLSLCRALFLSYFEGCLWVTANASGIAEGGRSKNLTSIKLPHYKGKQNF